MMPSLVTFGEALAVLASPRPGPLRHVTTLDVRVAGSELNVAIGFARLGGEAHWFGRVSTDELGERTLGVLRSENVDVSGVVRDPRPTGLLLREQRTSDRVRVSYYRDGSPGRRLTAHDLDLHAIKRAGVLHVTGITVALSETSAEAVDAAIAHAKSANVPISLDCNYRRALWSQEEAAHRLNVLAARCDIVFGTPDELALVSGQPEVEASLRAIAGIGPTHVVAKLGRAGALSLVDGSHQHATGIQVAAVDPIGAGDAFVAGYLTEYLGGAPANACLDVANRCGAICAATLGDYEGTPTKVDLEDLFAVEDVRR